MSDKAPLIVTLVLAIIGWAVTHVVDRLIDTPTIELDRTTRSDKTGSSVSLRLTNLAHDKAFRKIEVVVTAPEGETITDFAVVPVEPAFEGGAPATTSGRSGDFTFPEIQPG